MKNNISNDLWKSILLKNAYNKDMELENIFNYFNNIKIISNYDGYFYIVNEVLKILLLAFSADVKTLEKYTSG